jgi:hypothetical protein
MCWHLSTILDLKYLDCKDRLVLYHLLVIKGLHDIQFHLSISQTFITVRPTVFLPHSDQSMLGIAIMSLNGQNFIKEFNFLRTLLHAIGDIWYCICKTPSAKNILHGIVCKCKR